MKRVMVSMIVIFVSLMKHKMTDFAIREKGKKKIFLKWSRPQVKKRMIKYEQKQAQKANRRR